MKFFSVLAFLSLSLSAAAYADDGTTQNQEEAEAYCLEMAESAGLEDSEIQEYIAECVKDWNDIQTDGDSTETELDYNYSGDY